MKIILQHRIVHEKMIEIDRAIDDTIGWLEDWKEDKTFSDFVDSTTELIEDLEKKQEEIYQSLNDILGKVLKTPEASE